jgi:nitrogen regulatory protein PII
MTNESPKLVTVFTEAALESQLIKDLQKLGAPGYTITNARGKGHRGSRDASWEANSNIRLEIICSQKVANRIAEHLQETYYDNYAMVTFSTDVEVLRAEKFTG